MARMSDVERVVFFAKTSNEVTIVGSVLAPSPLLGWLLDLIFGKGDYFAGSGG